MNEPAEYVVVSTTVTRAQRHRLDELALAASAPGAMVSKAGIVRWLIERWLADGGTLPTSGPKPRADRSVGVEP